MATERTVIAWMTRQMTDPLSRLRRSELMSRIRSKDTGPELIVRRLVHSMGFRYRLHVRDLPGCPDLVFVSRGKIIFVHGCFWHLHKGCARARIPKSHLSYWTEKLRGNVLRDAHTSRRLRNMGWSVLTVWECQVEREAPLERRIRRFLEK